MASQTPVQNDMADITALSGNIVVETFDDSNSEYADSFDTTTLKSSILVYVYENGRRYHPYHGGQYPLPNDEYTNSEQIIYSLDMYHHICTLLLDGRLFLSPLDNPQRILDIGTGTGVWALDAAKTYPSAEVIGIDLSPIHPVCQQTVRFEIGGAENDWTFPPVHCQPGGYIELVEAQAGAKSDDNTIPEGAAILKLFDHWQAGAQKLGLNLIDGEKLKKWAVDAGFEDVQLYTFKQPWDAWPADKNFKTLGRCMLMNCETELMAYSLAIFTRVLGMSQEDAEKVCDLALGDVRNRKMHIYNYHWHVIARKPLVDKK
ncbi:S-adenosyl-L-methionine-dependent methyltransferase [Choiromyces venosus 120613-1]|uniref:S-adenosyl-L-methionine-dependent methyltransferase n=1 Tax=Choiromyces venosus 120613-1 TaxID=1336337 RepID=A0A3N4JZ29_9PEZI|nr:S-adenosyl-L-methionine-dependent methyltransferase [Choiromyces venosus 120613-1]